MLMIYYIYDNYENEYYFSIVLFLTKIYFINLEDSNTKDQSDSKEDWFKDRLANFENSR